LIKRLIYTISFSGCYYFATAQVQTTTTMAAWGGYFFTAPVSSKWSLVGDAQVRSKNGFSQLSQFLIRAGVAYNVRPKWSVIVGAANFQSSGKLFNEAILLNEFRLWQENAFQLDLSPFNLFFRTRMEQRWLQRPVTDSTVGINYINRLRNKVSITYPLSSTLMTEMGTEVMVVSHQSNMMDLLRAFAGIYVSLNNNVRCQIQYLYQCQYKADALAHYRDNQHIIRINILQDFSRR
jgi:hypothetical protein